MMLKENVIGQHLISESQLIDMNINQSNSKTENQLIETDILDLIYGRNGEEPLNISDNWREIVEILMEPA